MKIKYIHIIILGICAAIVNIAGSMSKVMHWEFHILGMKIDGNSILNLAMFFGGLAAVLLIIKIVLILNNKV